MRAARALRRVVARLDDAAVGEQHARDGRRRRRVEPDDDHPPRTSIVRRSPPAWASVTWRGDAAVAEQRDGLRALRPLDERDRVRPEVRVEQARVLAVEAGQPVEVEVRERAGRAVVEDPDDEGRAGDRLGHAERAQRAAHEGRLAGAELARDEHDVARPQLAGEGGAGLLGRRRAVRSR